MPERALPPLQEGKGTRNPFLGMFANKAAGPPVGAALLVENYYLNDGVYVARPGLTQLGTQLVASKVQGIVNYEELDGTLHTLAFANADMYEYDWGLDTWTQTDLAAQGVTMDASSPLDFANSRGRLIVTDGVNTPWMWDGTTFTVLVNAPIAAGVTVYYDKVFFFDKPTAQNEFEWSDEGNPQQGYAAVEQAWEFAQTDAGAIKSLGALNNSLVVLKEDSAANVRGAVEETFQTDAVREGLSETEGTIARRSVVVVDGDVFFLSQNGPRMALRGQRLLRINHDPDKNDRLNDVWADVDRANWSDSFGLFDSDRRHVWWFVPESGSANRNFVLVYSIDEDAWQGFRFASTFDFTAAAGRVEDTSGNEHVLVGDANGNVLSIDSEANSDDGVAITYKLRSRLYGTSQPQVMNRLAEVRMFFNTGADPFDFTLRHNEDHTIGGGIATRIAGESGRLRYRRGMNATGYGVGWELEASTLNEVADIEATMVIASVMGSYPDV